MSRPIEFNRDQALNAAMKLFWRQGYVATSMNQLLQVMKISRSSFYAGFVDKRSVFVESLNLFSLRTRNLLLLDFDSDSPLTSVRAFFDKTTFDIPQWRINAGCMMVNTILELADVDPELSHLAAERLNRIELDFVDLFKNKMQDPVSAASVVMTLNKGIRVSSRTGASAAELDRTISATLKLLEQAA
mgnify:CR=1 FL=1|jgi:TetR/AcrR family transcriptional regulator, transcriptional repressor for nem operon